MLSWLEPKLNGDELATTSAVLDVAEELAADAFLSHYKQADQSEPRLEPDGVHERSLQLRDRGHFDVYPSFFRSRVERRGAQARRHHD